MRFEIDEVAAAGLAQYESITLTAKFKYDAIVAYGENPVFNNIETVCYINNVEVTGKEWDMVWDCLNSAHSDKLTKGDFVDLGEVERILEKVCTKQKHDTI